MPYCSNCGKELPENAAFCPNCGAPVKRVAETKPIVLAGWWVRFAAWLIDVLIIGAVLSLLARARSFCCLAKFLLVAF